MTLPTIEPVTCSTLMRSTLGSSLLVKLFKSQDQDRQYYFLTDEEEEEEEEEFYKLTRLITCAMCYAQEWQCATHSTMLGTYTNAPSSNQYSKQ